MCSFLRQGLGGGAVRECSQIDQVCLCAQEESVQLSAALLRPQLPTFESLHPSVALCFPVGMSGPLPRCGKPRQVTTSGVTAVTEPGKEKGLQGGCSFPLSSAG